VTRLTVCCDPGGRKNKLGDSGPLPWSSAKLRAAGQQIRGRGVLLPFASLRCYEKYDCTVQQLIDTGTVLINGER
jgi:hypothetical protein